MPGFDVSSARPTPRVAAAAIRMAAGVGLMLDPVGGKFVYYCVQPSTSAGYSETAPSPLGILPSDVQGFVDINRLAPHLETAASIIRDCFPASTRLDYRLVEFPDFEGKRLVANVLAPGSTDDALASYDRFLDQWIPRSTSGTRELLRFAIAVC